MKFILAFVTTLCLFITPAFAATKKIELSVPTLTKADAKALRGAITKVSGVEKMRFNFIKKEAKVVYDDTKTNEEAILKASKDAGHPATVVEMETKKEHKSEMKAHKNATAPAEEPAPTKAY